MCPFRRWEWVLCVVHARAAEKWSTLKYSIPRYLYRTKRTRCVVIFTRSSWNFSSRGKSLWFVVFINRREYREPGVTRKMRDSS